MMEDKANSKDACEAKTSGMDEERFAAILYENRLHVENQLKAIMEQVPEGYFEHIRETTPAHVFPVLADIIAMLLSRHHLEPERIETIAALISEGELEAAFAPFLPGREKDEDDPRRE